jgi:type II secretory ATPase GspE/PulE/Tfp pilus assembly ATPase PilB-like protein
LAIIDDYKRLISYGSFYFSQAIESALDCLRPDELLKTPGTMKIDERVLNAMRSRGVAVVTGEAGSGKSTALRLALAGLHPAEF